MYYLSNFISLGYGGLAVFCYGIGQDYLTIGYGLHPMICGALIMFSAFIPIIVTRCAAILSRSSNHRI